MTQHLDYVALVVRDYDEAIGFYTHSLGFQLIEDMERLPCSRISTATSGTCCN
jgi:catechol 2,3-dioxygenase-like lactoylglutathione lyase family enzyme